MVEVGESLVTALRAVEVNGGVPRFDNAMAAVEKPYRIVKGRSKQSKVE